MASKRSPRTIYAVGKRPKGLHNALSMKRINVTGVTAMGFTKKGRAKRASRISPVHKAAVMKVQQSTLKRGYRGIAQKGGIKSYRADTRTLKAAGLRRGGRLGQFRRRRVRRNYKGRFAGSY